jgi:hypothetical protein
MISRFFRRKSKNAQKYILWVTTKHNDGGYSSRWHGWSRDLVFTHKEALKERDKLIDKFYDVEIVEI